MSFFLIHFLPSASFGSLDHVMFLNIKLTFVFSTFCLLIKHDLSAPTSNPPQHYSISTDASLRTQFPATHQILSRVNMHLLFWQVIAVHVILWVLSSFSLNCSLRKLQGFGYFGLMLFRLRYVFFVIYVYLLSFLGLISFSSIYRSCWHLLLRMGHVLMLRLLPYQSSKMLVTYLRVPLPTAVEL